MLLAITFLQQTLNPNCQVDISVFILDILRNTLKRKLSEALFIHRDRPLLNEKSELESIVKYLQIATGHLYMQGIF